MRWKIKNDNQNVQSSALCAVDQWPRENIILLYIFIIIRSIYANVWQHLARGDPGQCAVGLPWSGGVQIKNHAAYHTTGVSTSVYITILSLLLLLFISIIINMIALRKYGKILGTQAAASTAIIIIVQTLVSPPPGKT